MLNELMFHSDCLAQRYLSRNIYDPTLRPEKIVCPSEPVGTNIRSAHKLYILTQLNSSRPLRKSHQALHLKFLYF